MSPAGDYPVRTQSGETEAYVSHVKPTLDKTAALMALTEYWKLFAGGRETVTNAIHKLAAAIIAEVEDDNE